jgi:small-conductance mechanosensitive channel
MIAASFWSSDVFRAIVYVVITLIIAKLVDVLISRFGGGVTHAVKKDLAPADKTRLVLARRLIVAAILFVGFMFALFTLPGVGSLARAMLASAAFTAVILGIAARSTFANPLAGLVIAIAQPVRIGDYVTVSGISGTVEEVGLSYTYIRTGDNRRLIIPNEQLVSTMVENYSIVEAANSAAADFVVPAAAPLAAVTRIVVAEAEKHNDEGTGRDATVAVKNITVDGVTVRATVWAADKPAADSAADALRAAALGRLAAAGLLTPADT